MAEYIAERIPDQFKDAKFWQSVGELAVEIATNRAGILRWVSALRMRNRGSLP